MGFLMTEEQYQIRAAIERMCADFGEEYWLRHDREGGFPVDFHKTLTESGWLGVAMPSEFGGSGLGITEAAIVMQTIAESGAGQSGASSVHINIFGLNPVVVFGTDEQEGRWHLPSSGGKTGRALGSPSPMPA